MALTRLLWVLLFFVVVVVVVVICFVVVFLGFCLFFVLVGISACHPRPVLPATLGSCYLEPVRCAFRPSGRQ